MDQFNSDQQEQLKNSSTERLRIKLCRAGEDEDTVCALDRPQLLEAVARKMMIERVLEEEVVVDVQGATEIRLREVELWRKRS